MEENTTIPQPQNLIPKKERIISFPLSTFILAMILFAGGTLGYMKYTSLPPVEESGLSPRNDASTNREKAIRDMQNLFSSFEEALSLTKQAEGSYDFCERATEGTSFNNECNYSVIRLYGFNGDFREKALAIDAFFKQDGWKDNGRGLIYIITEYFDTAYGPDKPKPASYPI